MAGFVSEERLAYGPWPALERMLARLVEHAGFKDVSIVGGSGDGGADIVATVKQQRWVIQAKYRRSGVMNELAGQEAVRALSRYKGDVAIAATNQTFSSAAYSYHKEVQNNGIDLRLWNGSVLLNFFRQLPRASAAMCDLRDYQADAVSAVEHARSEGSSEGLIVMATGLGKSIVANQLVVNELYRNRQQEVLVLAHTTSLVRQLEQTAWSQLGKDHSTHLWTDGESPAYFGGVVFATWQSIAAAVTKGGLSGRFGLVVVDEAHHAPSDVFRRMLESLEPNFLVGLTATPWRGDDVSLSEVFGDPLYTMDIVDGMQRGFLAEVDYRMLTDGIDWEEIAILSRQGLTVRNLNERLIMPDRDIAMIDKFASHFNKIDNSKALVFCRSIKHAERVQPLLASHGIKAALVHSRLPRDLRFRNLSGFRMGQIDCLISIEMLNEGIDVPDVNMVAFMRVTHSRRIFIQQLGRGLRMQPGKSRVLVLDFVADIRRIAAGLNMNQEAAERGKNSEVIRFRDGQIVNFDNDKPASFFNEYLADVANIETIDDSSRLRFPDNMDEPL